jgi:hypothetical protein
METPFALGDLHLTTDVSAADWIVAGVRNFEYDVGSLVPVGFAAYARVFHPARRHDADGSWSEVSWRSVAAANGKVAHAGMEWIAITGSWRFLHADQQPGIWDAEPSEGSLPARQAQRLSEVLRSFTTTPLDCSFAIWDGYGGAPYPRDTVPKVMMPNRQMVLFRGPLQAATTSLATHGQQSAHLWWPDDRSWCVATDVDLMTTYVAGSVECIAAVEADQELEALPVTVDQSVSWRGDTINPTPEPPLRQSMTVTGERRRRVLARLRAGEAPREGSVSSSTGDS